MSRFVVIHPENPQPRLIGQVVECLAEGGVVVYPTDSSYALGCRIGDKEAMERIRRIRQLDEKHNFSLVCRDLSEIATYAMVDNSAYRLLRALTPGPYTFICRPPSKCRAVYNTPSARPWVSGCRTISSPRRYSPPWVSP